MPWMCLRGREHKKSIESSGWMNIELTERELRYLNRVVNVRLDELIERCARIRRIRSLEDIITSERFSIAESEIKVMKGFHDKIADALSDCNM